MLHHTYISLGSNKGNRFNYLQLAIENIHESIGNIKAISKVYQSPSWGFNSDDFLNCCIHITTLFSPEKVLDSLLTIEEHLGRKRNNSEGYEARTIDLDIIYYDNIAITTKKLTIPHPQIANRKFVLQPLADLVQNNLKFHGVTISEMLHACKDDSVVVPIPETLVNPHNPHRFSEYNFIAIEGNIGSGKTSLATLLSEEYNAKLILERFAENAFLPKFYEDQSRFAFPLEMSFLADRYQQLSEDIAQYDLFKEFVVSDYHISKSLNFAKVTLPEDEFLLYRKFFSVIYKDMQQPDLYVYLYQNTERLLENIKKRGRDYEQNIQPEYLRKINAGYMEFMKSHPQLNIKVIDVSDLDFIANRADYLKLLNAIATS